MYQERLSAVMSRIEAACQRAHRNPSEIKVIGVTKTAHPDAIPALVHAGVCDFGENRWQHARDMLAANGASEATWHFIGHLQMNKVKYIVRNFQWLHSIDSVELAEAVSAQAVSSGRSINGLVQVNVSGESTKQGLPAAEVENLIRTIALLPGLQIRGLMTMAPRTTDTHVVRTVFRELRELQTRLADTLHLESFSELSMGMSEDFELAVEEGATMIRLGRILMGQELKI